MYVSSSLRNYSACIFKMVLMLVFSVRAKKDERTSALCTAAGKDAETRTDAGWTGNENATTDWGEKFSNLI